MTNKSSANHKPLTETPLAERLRARICREEPISFHDWMQAALYDDREGYYCRGDRVRWGREGDYRTAPERSPLFAATFARYFAKLFVELGSPSAWTIIEAGAGSGEFARGVLATLERSFGAVFAATQYLLDELSEHLQERARLQLSAFAERVGFSHLEQIRAPIPAGIIFSNELLDAFPVHRVRVRGGRLRELCVGVDEKGEFHWVDCEPRNPRIAAYFKRAGVQLKEGQTAEVNLGAEDWMARAAAALKSGFVVSVDYGAERDELLSAPQRRAGTLRAFHRHRMVQDPLAHPGQLDLTTTVDWTQIREAGERAGLETIRFERLDQFLLGEGLLDEMEKLAPGPKSEAEVSRMRASAREMIMPDGMATAFQVLVQRKA